MYVELDTASLISTPHTEVFADLRFYVFNKKENKYFTLQYVEPKPFKALRTVWGLSQVLKLETFNDVKKGYLFDGNQCEFGVDVVVSPPPTNWEILLFNENFYRPKFSWTLKNFSALKEFMYKSNIFQVGGRKWSLELYPKGDTLADNKWLSIYLRVVESEKLKEDEKIYKQARVRLVDPRGLNHLIRNLSYWHNKSNPAWGFSKFASLDELQKAYLDEDGSLNIEIDFDVVSETKFSPII